MPGKKMFVVRALLAMVIVMAGTPALAAGTAETGFLNRSIAVEGVAYRYQVYVPREYSRATAWPVILALHGGGEYGSDGFQQTRFALADAIRRPASRLRQTDYCAPRKSNRAA